MKHFLLSVVAVCVCAVANAIPVDYAAAKKLAESVINRGVATVEKTVEEVALSAEVNRRMSVSPVAAPAFYVFGAEEGGFAIVSGDDEFPELIGYSTTGRISIDGSLPEALVAYLEAYSRYVEDVRKGLAEAPVADRVFRAGTPVVGPMCVTKWGQTSPFNNMCPKINMRYAPVGCIATAMAQVMYYHKHPESPTGKVSYYTGSSTIGNITLNFDTLGIKYHWDEMKPTVAEMTDSASRASVARLSYDCGVAARMQYNLNGSGTSDAECARALRDHFAYSKASVSYIMRDWFATQEEWNAMVLGELDARRPVIYCGSSKKGSGSDAAGHAFIFDGYDSEGNVHVNWGWTGSADGYYNIVTLDMGQYAFSDAQSMISGIMPDNGADVPQSKMLVFHGAMKANVVSASLGKRVMMTCPDFYNYDAVAHTWNYGVGLFDKHGRFLQCVTKKSETFASLSGYDAGNTMFVTLPSKLRNGEAIAAGDYVLRFIVNENGFTLEDGSEDWITPYCYGGEKANWYPVEIKGGKAYFDQVSSAIESVEAEEVQVVSSEYYDLGGKSVATPVSGQIVVEKQKLADGKVRSLKRRF